MRAISILSDVMWVMSALFAVYMCYYGIFLPFALKKKKPYPEAAPRCRFAVLVAARNEQTVIGHLVESLRAQDYPSDMFDILVVPNNCTDDTAGAARAAGAKIVECAFPVKSKGDVLRQVVAMLAAKRDYDAVCIFDADNVVDPGFLRGMNNAWCAGAKAAQGYRDSKNPYDTSVAGCYSIYYWMVNRFYSHTRSALGLSAIINGSGFMADLGLLREMGGWNTLTLTEDIEFTTKCILHGEKVHWVPEAVTYDEQPLTFAQSWRQRCRWSTGMYQCVSHYFVPLLKKTLKTRSRACFDQFVFLSAPIMQMVWLASLVLGQVLNVLQIHYNLFPTNSLFYSLFVSVATSYAISAGLAMLVVLMERKPLLPMLRGVFGYWTFVASWVPINLVCLFRRTTEWKAIAHTRGVKLSQIK